MRLARIRSQRGALLAVGVLVLVAAVVGTAWPRGTESLLDAALRAQVAGSGPLLRDLAVSFDPEQQSGVPGLARSWAAMPDAANRARRALPGPLRAIAGPVRFWGRTDGPDPGRAILPGLRMDEVAGDPAGTLTLSFEADPTLGSDTVLVAGSMPRSGGASGSGVLQVAISQTTAQRLVLHLGQVLHMTQPAVAVRITGLLRPRDAADDYWTSDPVRLAPQSAVDPDDHEYWQGLAFVSSTDWPAIAAHLGGAQTSMLVPLAATASARQRLTDAAVSAVRAALVPELTQPLTGIPDAPPITFSSGFGEVLGRYKAAAAPVSALLAVTATGPLAALVLLIAIALLVARRSRARDDRIGAARGASGLRRRLSVAWNTAVACVPAAVAGGLCGVLLTPGGQTPPGAAIALAALLPPLGAAVLASGRFETGRPAPRRRLRFVAECVVVALTALGIAVLLQRGLSGQAPDPVVLAVPLLVSLAVCVPVLRLFPRLVRRAGSIGSRGAGVTALLGSRLAATGSGALALVALVCALGIAAASTCVLGTLETAVTDVADRAVGASLLVRDDDGLPATLGARLDARGATTAAIATIGFATVAPTGGGSVGVAVLAADPASIARVQAALPPRDRLLDRLAQGGALAYGTGQRGRTSLGLGSGVTVTARAVPVSASPVFTSEGYWVLVDRSVAPPSLLRSAPITALLVGLPAGADESAVVRAIRSRAPGATVASAAAEARVVGGAPLVGGLVDAIALATACGAAGAAAALALSLVAAARVRSQLAATLRAIGLSGRQSAALLVWDAAPIAVVGLAGGLVAGVGAAVLLLIPLDLAPLTGGAARPPFSPDPALLGFIAAVALGAAAIGTVAAQLAVRRADTAAVLRFQEGAR